MLKGKHVTLRAIEREDIKSLHELTWNVESSILADGAYIDVVLMGLLRNEWRAHTKGESYASR